MFIVSLIAPRGMLDPSLVENLRNAWGGGDAEWLSPDEAAEFPVNRIPDNQWEVWETVQAMQVDLVVQPAQGRRRPQQRSR